MLLNFAKALSPAAHARIPLLVVGAGRVDESQAAKPHGDCI